MPKFYLLDEVKDPQIAEREFIRSFSKISNINEKASLISSLKVVDPEVAKSLLATLKPQETKVRPGLKKFTTKQEQDEHSFVFIKETPDPILALGRIYAYLAAISHQEESPISHENERLIIALDYVRYKKRTHLG